MGNLSSRQARKLLAKGDNASKHENFDEAVSLYLSALNKVKTLNELKAKKATQKKAPPALRLEEARCLDRLAKIHWRVGELEEALDYCKTSLAIKDEVAPGSAQLARSLNDIGCLLHERGETEKGYFLLEAAMQIREAAEPGSHALGVTYNNLAILLRSLGRREEAKQRDEQAQKIKEVKCPKSPSMINTHLAQAHNATHAGTSNKHLSKAKSLAKNITPESKSVMGAIENTEGCNLSRFGNGKSDLVAAVPHFEKAVALEESVAGESLALATMCVNLADAYEKVGRHDEARKARARSIAIRERKAPILLDRQAAKNKPASL